MEEECLRKKQLQRSANLVNSFHPQQINVKIGFYSNENVDFANVEQGIEVNEFIMDSCDDSQSNHLDNCDNSTALQHSSSAGDGSTAESQSRNKHLQLDSASLSSVDSSTARAGCSNRRRNGSIKSHSLPCSLNCEEHGYGTSIAHHHHHQSSASHSMSSSAVSLSSHASAHRQSTGPSTLDPGQHGFNEVPTFILPYSSYGSGHRAPSSMPVLGRNSGPPPANGAHSLLLPPIWVPDEMQSECSSCCQVFNLIRRRHHCRRCGRIFCNQCSNNFISLECFGYAKPVRVCNVCMIVHDCVGELISP